MTIDWIEGFEHQVKGSPSAYPDGSLQPSLWYFGEGTGQTTFPAGRTGVCMHMVQNGAANVRQIGPLRVGSAQRHFSFFLKMSANPSVESTVFRSTTSGGAANHVTLTISTAGLIKCQMGGGTTITGPDVVDGNWHRIDVWGDTSTTTWVAKWRVDGAAQTDSTQSGQTAGSLCAQAIIGSSTSTHTATFDIDDLVSGSAGDTEYPFNGGVDYNIGSLLPNADGTHNNASSFLVNEAGGVIGAGGGAAYSRLNTWPYAGSVLVKMIGFDADDYAEILFGDTSETNILGAAIIQIGGGYTAENFNAQSYVYDSGNNNILTIYNGNMGGGSTADRGLNTAIPPPGGDSWTQAELNGLKVRFGYSGSNVNNSTHTPKWQEFMVQYIYAAPTTPPVIRKLRTVSSPLRW
jgi:hypothetical protein